MDTTNRHEKELVLAQILYLFVLPTLLLYYGIIPGQLRIILLFVVALFLYGIIKRAQWTYDDLALRTDYMKDIVPYVLFTIGGIGLLLWVWKINPYTTVRPNYEWWEDARFLLLFIPISVLQEVIFRGILMKLLRHAFKSPLFIILINASLFTLIHIIYAHSVVVLPLTFIGGIGFAWIYYTYPNLILISISHTILNFIAMILGFFIVR